MAGTHCHANRGAALLVAVGLPCVDVSDIPAPESNWLWSRSRGRCAKPGCSKELVTKDGDKRVTVGERAHIRSGKPDGPRYEADYGDVDRYENLILLCLEHHTLIDAQPDAYPTPMLEGWKADHEGPAGPPPGTWLLPPPASPHYLRREAEYSEVVALAQDHPAVVIAGISGSGKTQAAIDHFTVGDGKFTIRAWIRAGDPEALAEDFASLGVLLNVFPVAQVDDGPSFTAKVRAALEASEGWLLVFDDAPGPAAVHDYLPRAGGTSVVTTQAQAWPDHPIVQMPPLPSEQSIDLLSSSAEFRGDPEASARVAELLGGLPLAIVQVLGFRAATGLSAADVSDLLARDVARLMARGEPPDHAALRSVVEQCTNALTSDARSLLQALACVAAVPLPVPHPSAMDLPADAGLPSWQSDALALEDAIADLRRFSLIERMDDWISVHGLTQAITLDLASTEERRLAPLLALTAIETRLPARVNREDHVPTAAALLPHVLKLVSHLEAIPDTGLFSARLLNRLAPTAGLLRDPALERLLMDQALLLVRSDAQPDLVTEGSILSNLSNLVIREGDVDRAVALAREALVVKRAGGADAFSLAITIGVLGTHLEAKEPEEALGHFKEATQLLEQAGAIRDWAESRIDESRVLHTLGRKHEAIAAAEDALEVAESDPDAWSERSSAELCLANLFERTGTSDPLVHAEAAVRHAEACPLATRALARALGTRGRLRGNQGEAAEAVADLRRSCSIFLEVEGESADYGMALGNLGRALLLLAEHSGVSTVAGEALSCLRQSRDLLTEIFPAGHPTPEVAEIMLLQAQAAVFGTQLLPAPPGASP
jgi:tetratricopeptide (TPR) repeat protein